MTGQVLKKTSFMTNIPEVVRAFENKFCDGTHAHCHLGGSEGGMDRAAYSALYPEDMVLALVDAMCSNIGKVRRVR